uniref:UBX domain-containing protein 11 n=1 Tax=Strigamia maritima TaxID=126957 RepID=T1J3W0_STRMM
MTTPISSLKKTKRSPLPSPSQPTADSSDSFRHPDFSDDQIQHLTENVPAFRLIRTMRPFRQSECGLSLLETINTNPRGCDDSSTLKDVDSSSTLSSNDHELISLLMSRLVQLENRLSDAHKQLLDKEKKIYKLEDKLRSLEKIDYNAASSSELDLQYKKLQQQVSEMEKFLNDYGMIWIGSKRSSSLLSTTTSESSKEDRIKSDLLWKPDSSVSTNKEFHVDYDLVVGNIKELNILAGDGKSQIDVTSGSAKLKTIEPIPLTLYANGILMFAGPFRPFTDTRTRDCIQDFMDGFYPSELQPLYPEGVPFKVSDKRHVVYRGNKIPFTGVGMHLFGDETSEQETDPDMKECLLVTSDFTSRPSSTRRFLEKLPKVVINSGKLFNIRDSIAHTIQDPPKINNKIVNVPTPASKRNNGQKSKRRTISIRVKSEAGTEVYLLKLYVDDTFADMCKYLDSCRPDSSEYEIISLCPYKVFNNKNATLRES